MKLLRIMKCARAYRTRRVKSLSKSDVIEVEGVVKEAYPNAMFEVQLENGHKILALPERSEFQFCCGF